MKKLAVLLVLLLIAAVGLSAAEKIVEVHLVDGQIITGKIIEKQTYPDERIKIQTEDGTVYVVKMEDVDKIVEPTAESAVVAVEIEADPPLTNSYFFINLLGFLQWGPSLGLGFSLAEDLYIAPHLRLDGLGALNWIIFPEDTYLYTPAIGVSFLHYMDISPLNINRLYYGGGLEVEAGGETPFDETVVNIFGNIGYRWRKAGQKRFMNVGAHLGASYDTWWEELMLFAMAELSFGWDLGK